MHPRIDFALVLCALGLHDEVRVAERSVYPTRTVILRRCVRCSRHLAPRGRPAPPRIETAPTPSRYS